MQVKNDFKSIILIFIIYLIPFVNFLENNVNELSIIFVESFYLLIIIFLIFLIFLSYSFNFIFKKVEILNSFLIVFICYWLLFQHNFLTLEIKNFFNDYLFFTEYASELSLFLIILLCVYFSALIFKKKVLFNKIIYIYFPLAFLVSLYQVISFDNFKIINKNRIQNNENKEISSSINFTSKAITKKNNIYFFILDGMQPIKDFDDHYKINSSKFLNYTKSKNFKYLDDTINLYDNTTYSLTALFYLDKILDNQGNLKKKTQVLYPTLLRKNNNPDLLINLKNLGYDFKWIGNEFARCSKFQLKHCLNKNQNKFFDSYLYINFFRQTPLIQVVTYIGLAFNYDYNKHLYYEFNNGMGRLVDYLVKNSETKNSKLPTFYFVHHMSPHWPYITNKNCKYKYFPGKKNYEGYEAAYLCNLKRIIKTIEFIDKFDKDSYVVFQSDHNWNMSRSREERKRIFNLIKMNENCIFDEKINIHNVNAMRLILSCITNSDTKFLLN
jgi:hypothetical protein